MIRRKDMEAETIRLIVTTREKFPHSVAWNEALKQVIWRYTAPEGIRMPKGKQRRASRAR